MRAVQMLVLTFLLSAPGVVFGQSDGSLPPADEKPAEESVPASQGGASVMPEPEPVPSDTGVAQDPAILPATSSTPIDPRPIVSTSTPESTVPVAPDVSGNTTDSPGAAVGIGSVTIETEVSVADSGANPWWWLVVIALALIPFGFLAMNYLKKKPASTEESDNRCFDIKQMMEEKLRELTDVRALLEGKAKGAAKDALRDAVSGTASGDLLVRLEKLESQYAKLKALFEECRIDVEGYAYKGVVIEDSLIDKKVLEEVNIIGTRMEGEQALHDIRLGKKQIEEIQKNIIDETWHFHVWEPGKDQVLVVFKDKIFSITHSDMKTWEEAIAYGEARGIPRAQLDFRID